MLSASMLSALELSSVIKVSAVMLSVVLSRAKLSVALLSVITPSAVLPNVIKLVVPASLFNALIIVYYKIFFIFVKKLQSRSLFSFQFLMPKAGTINPFTAVN